MKKLIVGLVLLLLCTSVAEGWWGRGRHKKGPDRGSGYTLSVAASDASAKVRASADYICDGVDDQVQIQAAIDALPAIGGKVSPGEGTFSINGKINLRSYLTLKGYGRNTIFQATATLMETMLEADTKTDVVVSDMTIDGTGQGGASSYGLYLKTVKRFSLSNLYICDTNKDTLIVSDCNDGTINNITTVNSGNHAVFIGYGSTFINCSNIISRNPGTEHICIEWQTDGRNNENIAVSNVNGTGSTQSGIYIQHAKDIAVSNCTIVDFATDAVDISDAENISISNCIFKTSTTEYKKGIHVTSTAKRIVINNCILEGIHKTAFYVDGNSVLISNCYTYDCKADLYVSATGSYVGLFNNHFEYNTWGSCEIAGSYVLMQGNVWSNTSTTPTQLVYLRTGCSNITIVDNDMTPAVLSEGNKIHEETAISSLVARNNRSVGRTATGTITLQPWWGEVPVDSSGAAVTATLPGGRYIGETITIVMTEASNSSTVSVTNHETEDPEVGTFDAVDETWVLMWTGTEWATIKATCTF